MAVPDERADARRSQSELSTRLAEQVGEALLELLRGFQAADACGLLGELVRTDPEHVHGGLVTVLLRLVFLLYAEDRGLMPGDAVTGLYLRLREDAGNDPDTMEQRHGAWARLLALFRLVYTGGTDAPARRGSLFHPGDAGQGYPFLEGRPRAGSWQPGERLEVPRVSDGVVWRVLDRLLVIGGERLSYRSLDVEQIGSVYESMIGYTLERASGPGIAVRPDHVVVDLAELLSQKPADRGRFLKQRAGCELSDRALAALTDARTPEAAVAALGRKLSPRTPQILGPGSLYLQPGEQRRKSGSHYTPRTLTGPIVETTLRPVLAALGERPTPAQILSLKICDPAMGSGAFLVETCRQLGAHLARAWESPDEEPLLHARRLVAQRCLYGVDKNPVAVELARLSLWLITHAKDHPFTFLDHALKHGDSLVGLTRAEIAGSRRDGDADDAQAREDLSSAGIDDLRRRGDALIDAFFTRGKGRDKQRELRGGGRPVVPFHWELEFPEVFGREDPGFDCFVGNPPFLGGKRTSTVLGDAYRDWLPFAHPGSNNNADLVAFFFRRAFALLRRGGTLGLISTNTISQGDTRQAGLEWLSKHGGTIYDASRRIKWPGSSADVVVSVVHLIKGDPSARPRLDGVEVDRISAFLLAGGADVAPAVLVETGGRSFIGSYVLGMGFTFDDSSPEASSLAEMERLLEKDPRNRERIFPYIGGEEVNSSPTQDYRRHVIDFGDMSESEARRWPDLMRIVEAKVRPSRRDKPGAYGKQWWLFGRRNIAGQAVIRGFPRVLIASRVQPHWAVSFAPSGLVFSEALVIFAFSADSALSVIQSRIHELWARFLASTLEDRLRYTPTDCFETFPFPPDFETNPALGRAGEQYHEFRAELMVRAGEGLTATYNRFHDPDDRSPHISILRDLHAAMDRAVLAAYGWTDLAGRAACEFRLDYEDDDAPRVRARKKPWRYKWPQDLHDEVLARLLDLNHRRAEQERVAAARP